MTENNNKLENKTHFEKITQTIKKGAVGALGGLALMGAVSTTSCQIQNNLKEPQSIERPQELNVRQEENIVSLLDQELKNNPIGSNPEVIDEQIHYNNKGELIHSYTYQDGSTKNIHVKPDFVPGFTLVGHTSLQQGYGIYDIYKFCSKTGEISYFANPNMGDICEEVEWDGVGVSSHDLLNGKDSDGFKRSWYRKSNVIKIALVQKTDTLSASKYEMGGYPLLKNYCSKNNIKTGRIKEGNQGFVTSELYYDAEGNLHHKIDDNDKIIEPDYVPGMKRYGGMYEYCTENGEKTYYDENGQQLKYDSQYDAFVKYYSENGYTRSLNLQTGEVGVSVSRIKTNVQDMNREM